MAKYSINTERLVNNIQASIDKYIGQEKIVDQNLLNKIDRVVRALEQASINYEKRKQGKKEGILIARSYSRTTLKRRLMEGVAIVELVRQKITGEVIHYKIAAIGLDKQGQEIIVEKHPSLAEVLRQTTLEDSSGISLKITQTRAQFNELINQLEIEEKEDIIKNNALKKMQRVQLNDQQKIIWNLLKEIRVSSGKVLTYGQIYESLQAYQGEPITHETLFNLVQKGINNLPYYKGPDIDLNGTLFQLKTLTTLSQKEGAIGRFDIATLSNVLTPLKEIRKMLSPLDIEKLKKFFNPKQGEGNRKLNQDLSVKIDNIIDDLIKQLKN